ncbi:syndecan-4 [Salarias fasciatus]|uniref:Syndecan-4-like n=1 Tax=Salarias fasciatus TaxID=181472 RepID=A0A672G3G0_SALFA|nr:syndecan-4-like [Salarias fasciatus]
MLALCLVLLASSAVCSESVRETETWMPLRRSPAAALAPRGADPEASGDSPDGSDFGFMDDEDYYDDTLYDDEDEDEEFSGSGNGATETPAGTPRPSAKPDASDNRIPEPDRPLQPAATAEDPVQNANEIPLLKNRPAPADENPPNVLMAHAGDDSVFNKTEVLAALIAGGAVGLMFAVLLVLLLVHRMKKKDEGSYDLGRKPIYRKAPTTEIYA